MTRFSFALATLTFGLGTNSAWAQSKCCCAATPKTVPVVAKLAADDAKATPQSDKEVKLTGTLVCAKCKLKMDGVTKCTNALQVKDGETTVTYILNDKGMEEDYHECGGGEKKDVTVVGKVTEKDGKKTVKPTKVDVRK
jgi:3-oxoacyl-ACP reductase-like protein